MSKYIYGIDFGTTNSALAIYDTTTNTVIQLFTTPSLLFFPEDQPQKGTITSYIGEEAVSRYVESRMKGRFMKSIKRVLPNRSFTDTYISGKRFKAEDLAALILIFLKKQADDFLGETITIAVIGRPVVFDTNPEKDALAQERLSKAATIAGFDTFYFQMEPIGAAFTYERQMKQKELVLVGDFGGGTSDFSLMYLNPASVHLADRRSDMVAKGGIYIGGDSFDADLMWHRGTPHFGRGVKEEFEKGKWLDLPLSYFHNICSWEKMNFLDTIKWRQSINKSYIFSGYDHRVKNLQTLIEQNLGYLLFKQIELTKFDLSGQDNAAFTFQQFDIDFDEKVNIADFEHEIIKGHVDKIDNYLQQFLKNQHITVNEIDTVFLTGGTAYVRPLQQVFSRMFGSDKIKSGDNFNSVAMGIAYSYPVVSKTN